MTSPLAPSHGKCSQVPSPHISHVPERLASVPSRSRFSSSQTHFCIIEDAAAALTLCNLFCLKEYELLKTTDLKKYGNKLFLFPPAPSPQITLLVTCRAIPPMDVHVGGKMGPFYDSSAGSGDSRSPCPDQDLQHQLVLGALPTTDLSTRMTVSKDHLQAH